MPNTVDAAVASAFDGPWNSETRADLFRVIENQIPDLDTGYYLKHMQGPFARVPR